MIIKRSYVRKPFQVLIHPVRWNKNEWEFLMLKRVKQRGGFWQGITGGQEEGESLTQAAERELFEETGFGSEDFEGIIKQIDFLYQFPIMEEYRYQYSPEVEIITEYVFFVIISSHLNPIIDPNEHSDFMWVNIEEALELLEYHDNIKAIQCVITELKKIKDV